jgi:hypothetical protein
VVTERDNNTLGPLLGGEIGAVIHAHDFEAATVGIEGEVVSSVLIAKMENVELGTLGGPAVKKNIVFVGPGAHNNEYRRITAKRCWCIYAHTFDRQGGWLPEELVEPLFFVQLADIQVHAF